MEILVKCMHGSLNVRGLLTFHFFARKRTRAVAQTLLRQFSSDVLISLLRDLLLYTCIKLLAVCSVDGNRRNLFREKLFETTPR